MTSTSFLLDLMWMPFACTGSQFAGRHPPWPHALTRRRSWTGGVSACAQWGCFRSKAFVILRGGSLLGARTTVQTHKVGPTALLTPAARSHVHDC